LRHVQTKLLGDLAERLDGRYHLVFRGFQAALVALLLALFAMAAQVRRWPDVAALGFALSVLTGLHTFASTMRESFPVNQFLEVAVCGLMVLVLAQSRGGWWADLGGVICTAFAALTIETGVLMPVVALAAYVGGARGISRRGIVAMGMVICGIVLLRLSLTLQMPPFGERPTGFGLAVMSSQEMIARFGERRWLLYGWTMASAALSVLFSQPRMGAWTLLAHAQEGTVPLWMLIQVASSVGATLLIVGAAIRKRRERGDWRDPLLIVAVVVLFASSVVSYPYTKDQIVSLAGTFYALAVYAATRDLLERLDGSSSRIGRGAGVALLAACAVLWAVRSAGLHYVLRQAAFSARNEWVSVLPPHAPERWPSDPDWARIAARVKSEAMSVPTISPRLLPEWTTHLFETY
jgi:hypothetical protein